MSAPDAFPEVESSLASRLARLNASSVANPESDETETLARERLRQIAAENADLRYVFEEEIARGGMGIVYRVQDTELRRHLAMKVAIDEGVSDRSSSSRFDPVLLARFLEEARVTGQLDHPGIVPLHEVGIDARGRVYFTMRWVRGVDLGHVFDLARQGDREWTREKALEALVKVCQATGFAHSKGVVHRDLKPQNVMTGRFGEVYVMDWGVAKVLDRPHAKPRADASLSLIHLSADESAHAVTIAGSVFGTPAYIAPEQARGEIDRVDARSDIYSIGAILYHLLAGHAPYTPPGTKVSPYILLKWVIDGPPAQLAKLAPDAPSDLVAVCEKAMAREPSARYANTAELADDLRAWLVGRPVSARPLSKLQLAKRWCGRNPWIAALLAAVTLGGAIGLWRLNALGGELVKNAAIDDAASKARMLESVNDLYSSAVVARVDRAHVDVTHDWANKPGAIPLPATFLTELASRITRDASGTVKHFSDLPFKFRPPAKLDEFGTRALASLRANPDQPVISFEDINGRPMLRYAVARRMAQSCVDCHNKHPDSPKTDWKIGDVRGVLEIDRPLDAEIARSRSGLRTTLTVVASLVLGLTALCAFALVKSARGERRD